MSARLDGYADGLARGPVGADGAIIPGATALWLGAAGTRPTLIASENPECAGPGHADPAGKPEAEPRAAPAGAGILVVHDEVDKCATLCAALRGAGYDAVPRTSSLEALSDLDGAEPWAALVTRARFARGQPNGVALARMARMKRPGIKIVFFADPRFERAAEGLGEYASIKAGADGVLDAVTRLLHR